MRKNTGRRTFGTQLIFTKILCSCGLAALFFQGSARGGGRRPVAAWWVFGKTARRVSARKREARKGRVKKDHEVGRLRWVPLKCFLFRNEGAPKSRVFCTEVHDSFYPFRCNVDLWPGRLPTTTGKRRQNAPSGLSGNDSEASCCLDGRYFPRIG